MRKIVDAHACGEYLTSERIIKKLNDSGCDMVVLTPGQYGSKVTYGLKNLAKKHPYNDVVSKNNKTTRLMIKNLDITEEDLDKICGLNILKLLDRTKLNRV